MSLRLDCHSSILVAMGSGSADKNVSVRVSEVQYPAISFTLPSRSYRVDSVTLNLRDYSSASDRPVIAFYTDEDGHPGSLLGSPLRNPPSNSNRSDDFTFLPTSSLILEGGGTYWVQASSIFGSFSWNASGNDALTSRTPFGEAVFQRYKVGLNSGEIYVDDHPIPSFLVSATAVPEPTALALGGLALIGSWCLRGRNARGA
jgi:hypothetical protein